MKARESKRKLEIRPAWCDAVKPEAGAVDYFDTLQRGLVFRVEVSGRKSWACRYRFQGRPRRFRIGSWPEVKVTVARDRAKEIIGGLAINVDPAVERELLRIGQTVPEVVKAWQEDAQRGPVALWKGGTEGGTARAYMPHVRALSARFATYKLAALEPADVERFVSGPAAPATRNRRLQAVRMVVAWAKRKGLISADPTRGIEKETEQERSRVLSDVELQALIRGFDATRYGRAVRLLAYTGLRRDEVLGARWEWLDSERTTMTIPPEAEKTGKTRGEPRRVALSPQAGAVLAAQRETLFSEGVRSDFIFATSTGGRPHPDALKPTLNKLRGLRENGQPSTDEKRPKVLASDVTIHDIRRTAAQRLLSDLGAAPWIVDHVVLGHARPKLLRTYMPTLPIAEAREALTRWAEVVDGIVAAEAVGGAR